MQDNGIGMSKEFLSKMYEPFTQERIKNASPVAGSGLGLSIVKKLVELMGGTIACESELGKGTTFTLDLSFPKSEKPLLDSSLTPPPTKTIEGRHILVCEDNEMNAEIAKCLLEISGATCEIAHNGNEGVQAFLKNPEGHFDAILMDIRMPLLDGYGATQAIRQSGYPGAKDIPIIAMSADAYQSDVDKSLKSGMNAHLAKPVNPQKMVEVLSELIKASAKK
ncbi:MAG: response regulator [Bacilli bacterium]|nr:response regulator [Bacilli bacterium]